MSEYTLSLTAEEIDSRLINAVLSTEQSLTNAQKIQIQNNIGIDIIFNTTTADNGKFLTVVNGNPTWATIDNAEGVTF